MAAARNERLGAGMTPERWQQIKSVLAAVLETDPSERAAYLDRVCANDGALRSEVESLLAAEQIDASLLQARTIADSLEEGGRANVRIGSRIGAYQIVEEIGVGGMGEVYRAFRADDQYRKEVAIKLVRAGQDSRQVLAHFRNERQLLASLDHPNIARLLDGGTTEDGVPYFAMELIEGLPIDEYCDSHRLSITGRLKLFLQVCSALQYAHQRLIIHRDLKPGNILVTREGIPKLLDFGIAKILETPGVGAAEPTISIFRALTPAYASPEQIKGEAITTASDVYSLGVLLYEVLTGRRPYRSAGTPYEIAQAVCEFEPTKPSSVLWRNEGRRSTDSMMNSAAEAVAKRRDVSLPKLRKRLRGDLDNILLMALRKEPQRRYASVEQFAADIDRHLEDLPVTASKDTVRYRASKFVRRHRAGVTAGLVVTLTLLAGLGAILHEAHIARRQQLRAEQRFNDVRELANSLMFDVHDSIQDLPGSTPARKLLVERALRYLDKLSRDSSSDTSLQRELGTAYEKVGTVQGNPFGANLGDIEGALDSYRRSLAIRELLSKANPGSIDDRVALARSQRLFAAVMANRAGARDEQANLEREMNALAVAEQAYRLDPSNLGAQQEVQTNYDLLVTLRHYSGDYEGAWTYLQTELPIVEARLRAAPEDRSVRFALAKTEVKSGDELAKLGRRKEAFEHLGRGVAIFEALSANGTDANSRRYLAWAQDRTGDAWLMDGDAKTAREIYQKEIGLLEPLLASDPTNAVLQLDVGVAFSKIGEALALEGEAKGGLATLKRAAAILQSQVERDPSYSEPQWYLTWNLLWTDEVLERSGASDAALTGYRKVLGIWEGNDSALLQTVVAGIHVRMGALLAGAGKREQAAEEYKHALENAEQILASKPYMVDAQYVVADAYAGMGEMSEMAAADHLPLQQQIQRWTEARVQYQRSLDAWGRIQNPGARTPAGLACGSPRKIAKEFARCDARLREMQARTGKGS